MIHCSVSVCLGILIVFADQLNLADITHSKQLVLAERYRGLYFVLAALDILGAHWRQSIPHDEPELLNELLEVAINCKGVFNRCF